MGAAQIRVVETFYKFLMKNTCGRWRNAKKSTATVKLQSISMPKKFKKYKMVRIQKWCNNTDKGLKTLKFGIDGRNVVSFKHLVLEGLCRIDFFEKHDEENLIKPKA